MYFAILNHAWGPLLLYSICFTPHPPPGITKTAVKITAKPSLTSVTTTTAGTHSNATTNLKAPGTGTTKAPTTTITPGTSTTKPPGTGTTKAPATTITPGTSTTKPPGTGTTKAPATTITPGMSTTKPPGTTKAPATTKAPGTGTTKASGSADVASSKDGGGGKVSGRLESTVAGLKRKKLHTDSAGGDRYLLRKVGINAFTYIYRANDFPFQIWPISISHFIKFHLRAKMLRFSGFKES